MQGNFAVKSIRQPYQKYLGHRTLPDRANYRTHPSSQKEIEEEDKQVGFTADINDPRRNSGVDISKGFIIPVAYKDSRKQWCTAAEQCLIQLVKVYFILKLYYILE